MPCGFNEWLDNALWVWLIGLKSKSTQTNAQFKDNWSWWLAFTLLAQLVIYFALRRLVRAKVPAPTPFKICLRGRIVLLDTLDDLVWSFASCLGATPWVRDHPKLHSIRKCLTLKSGSSPSGPSQSDRDCNPNVILLFFLVLVRGGYN